jgi:hypothetical protein
VLARPVGSTAVPTPKTVDAVVTAAERALPGWAATHPTLEPESCMVPPTSSPNGQQSPIF